MHPDATLLKAFVSSGDESAFRRIVERHAPMVHGVAWRQTGNRTLAEEVTQTVFTILARKAAGLRHTELAGWLHRAAAMETRNASRKERRRGQALQELNESMIPETNPGQPVWQDISPHLDEAMTHLSAAERQAVVLRFFEQRSHREIAEATGRSEEASRKQVQRSLERLGMLLRRRGIATTGAALGAALSGQTLCVPPASAAAAFAATALQAAPSLTAATLLTHTLYTMTTHTILKTAATTAVLAAIPIGFLWEQNHSLKGEVRQLRAAAVPGMAAPVITPPAPPAAAMAAAAKTASPPAGARSAATAPPAKDANPLAAFASLFSGDGFVKIAEGQIRQDIARDMSRLSLRLSLTPEQREKLQAHLERLHGQQVTAFKKASEDGLLHKAMRDPKSITPEEKAKLERLDAEAGEVEDLDTFLKQLLSGDQMAEYVKSKDEQHAAQAEEKAQEMITALGPQLNLSTEQKDRIFQAVAARELAKPPGEEPAGTAADQALAGLGEDGAGIDREALMSEMAGSDRSHDDILREVLTPEQFTALEGYRADEEKQSRALFEAIFPGLAGSAGTEGDPESK